MTDQNQPPMPPDLPDVPTHVLTPVLYKLPFNQGFAFLKPGHPLHGRRLMMCAIPHNQGLGECCYRTLTFLNVDQCLNSQSADEAWEEVRKTPERGYGGFCECTDCGSEHFNNPN